MAGIRTVHHKEALLDLLLTVARRPSTLCVHLQKPSNGNLQTRLIGNASTKSNQTSSEPKGPRKPSSPSPPSFKPSPNLEPTPSPSIPKSDPNSVPLRMLLDRNPSNTSAISQIPIPKGERGEKFTPSPLTRPLGLPYPPQPGQNAPPEQQQHRSRSERRADLADPHNVQAQRRMLLRSFMRPYFQEWKRLEAWKGKSFVANERLFRRERALWFPNLWGWTLAKNDDGGFGGGGSEGRDTTPVLKGRVSLVGIQSAVWAEEQVATFLGEAANPELKALVEASGGVAQKVEVNIQERWFRALLVKLFRGRLRKMRARSEWARYFSVRLARDVGLGLTEDVRDAMGLLNSQVGYVYLLDTDCRIRWAGSGHAWQAEIRSLNAGLRSLIQEARQRRETATVTAPVDHRRAEVLREGDLREQVNRALA